MFEVKLSESPGWYEVPEPSAAVFHPAKVNPGLDKVPAVGAVLTLPIPVVFAGADPVGAEFGL